VLKCETEFERSAHSAESKTHNTTRRMLAPHGMAVQNLFCLNQRVPFIRKAYESLLGSTMHVQGFQADDDVVCRFCLVLQL
jgi:hypothetical protein